MTSKKTCPLVVEWLQTYDKGWARHQFDGAANCRHVSNILGATFTQWVKKFRCLPIHKWVLRYEALLSDLFGKRSRRLSSWPPSVPRAWKAVKKQRRNVAGEGYVVHSTLTQDVWSVEEKPLVSPFKVDLKRRMCCCGEWQVAGIPCLHAMAVLVEKRPNDIDSYVDECFTVEKYQATYAHSIKLTASMEGEGCQQEPGSIVHPPPLKDARRKGFN
ncbi:uncharacterized protein LOC113354131 [Papaver somniferum]|uniref:uncharacterized protein LOC113354131 n=1 Tax=Papaver somniferum TaxID=3469 RepID=UPI000E6FD11F|nr:uncharacterized protein LOC113354131 [Papaver somniferum]XP_026453343.1 uncharacterized protein LOC113354131 [Papaver somniferum]